MIRDVKFSDAVRIAEIYNYYIAHTIITFEDEKVDAFEIQRRINTIAARHYPYLVAEENGLLTGYAYLNQWRERKAYHITLETSIYLDRRFTGKGAGSALYYELIERAKAIHIHSLIGVISLPNEASRRLHQKTGFRLVGNFIESGEKFDRLIDVECWQKIL
jgi:phosphinothricin acetyltransferase